MSKVYRNKKTGKYYEILLPDVINVTNAEDGQIMVLYINYNSSDITKGGISKRFVRERTEFFEKFERVH